MKTVIAFAALIAAVSAFPPNTVTGTTPPAIPCSDTLCDYREDGNYELKDYPNYFVQCVAGKASCQPCWPLSLFFSGKCNQCLYNQYDNCYTTDKWAPATTFHCPDECPSKGYEFSGNIRDPSNKRQYVACWYGVTVGCIACPGVLEFNEEYNACLYLGIYKTEPVHDSPIVHTTTHTYYPDE